MKKPAYLSPTSISKWKEDPASYYLRYLSDSAPDEEPQTKPMSVGSAFDAYVKSFLHAALFGKGADPAFEFDSIFESQVQSHNRDWARGAGAWCFEKYKELGALAQLMLDLGKSVGKVRFEMDVRGVASHGRLGEVRGVPYRVKPDLFFINEHGAHVIFDWKVNGFCSNIGSGKSPTKGFVRCRRSGKLPWAHDEAKLESRNGLLVNTAHGIEYYDESWARQLSVGVWMCGEEVGSNFIAIVHQLACRGDKPDRPKISIAEHVGFVSREFQETVHKESVEMWAVINSEHLFRHMSKEDSQALCKTLDKRRVTLEAGGVTTFIAPALDE